MGSPNGTTNFQISVSDCSEDIYHSLTKNEVFFVCTPELLRQYRVLNHLSKINLKCEIKNGKSLKFAVDLLQAYPDKIDSKLSHENAIIIFKFNKEKASNLIKNISKWTNHGEILGQVNITELSIIQRTIKDLAVKIKNRYFQNNVLEDKNWNGVVILNMPIDRPDNLPKIFQGIAASQNCFKTDHKKLPLETPLTFQYMAFPLKKTELKEDKGTVTAHSSSFFGLIDYAPFTFKKAQDFPDYKKIDEYFNDVITPQSMHKFVLSKLFIEFVNSSISKFHSYAFLQVPNLFNELIELSTSSVLSNPEENGPVFVTKPNLIRLHIMETLPDMKEIFFSSSMNMPGNFPSSNLIKYIDINRVRFQLEDDSDAFRFDIDAKIYLAGISESSVALFSCKELDFRNIGLRFTLKTPLLSFDLSKVGVVLLDF
jgi:hypothetical protein